MGRKIGHRRARIKKTLSTVQQQLAAAEPDCKSANNLRHYSNILSPSTESRADEAAQHAEAHLVAALDLS